ncbi:MAG: hypothetical protein L0154_22580 [Chloroflexi bacterium]|nr:hypothetical protein [Chloroflexota bacterium]
MKRRFTVVFTLSLVMAVYALSAWIWLKENTQPSGIMAVENTMRRLGEEMCGTQAVIQDDAIYFHCDPAMGHSNSVSLRIFTDSDAAAAAFDEWRKDHPVTDFHGYPSTYFENKDYMLPGGLQKVMAWRVKHMLFVVTSFDDTHFHIARDPLDVSETVYSLAREERLVPARR